MVTTLIDFFKSLAPLAFYAQQPGIDGYFDIEERIGVIDFDNPGPGLLRQVFVSWNDAGTVAEVIGLEHPYRLIVQHKSLIFAVAK